MTIIVFVAAIAAMLFVAWISVPGQLVPGLRISWRKGEGWHVYRDGWGGLEIVVDASPQ